MMPQLKNGYRITLQKKVKYQFTLGLFHFTKARLKSFCKNLEPFIKSFSSIESSKYKLSDMQCNLRILALQYQIYYNKSSTVTVFMMSGARKIPWIEPL